MTEKRRGTATVERVSAAEEATLLPEVERAAQLGSYVWKPGGQVAWSDGFYRVLGLEPGAGLQTEEFFARVHPEDRARVLAAYESVAAGNDVSATTYRIVRPDGEVRHLTGCATVTRDQSGAVVRIIGTIVDVTESYRAAVRLASASALLADTQRAAGVGSFVFDFATQKVERSDELCRILGVPLGSVGTPEETSDIIHPDDRDRQVEWGRRVASGEEMPPLLVRVIRSDGQLRHLETRGRRVEGEEGVRMLGVCIDITGRVELEQGLHRAARMEAVGTLAAGLAHDFNNHLTVVAMQSALMRRSATAEQASALGVLDQAVEQCATLTRQLLVFARQERVEPRPLLLNLVVQEFANMFRRVAGPSIQVQADLPDHPVLVEADPGQLEGILMNLALNGRDAMPVGGTLELSLSDQEVADDEATREGRERGLYARIEVRDQGVGILPEHLPRLFEPYFTTKELGKGTGLGLASVYGTVHQHRGFVRVDSRPGVGSSFQVYLPVAPAGATPEIAEGATLVESLVVSRGALVLVVEDTDQLRELVAAELCSFGYRAEKARDGAAALDRLAAGDRPAVLVTDLLMPAISGADLARRVAVSAPEVAIVFMTGYADPDILRSLSSEFPSSEILRKPFSIDELAIAIERALARRTSGALPPTDQGPVV
jgi:PAS domain S-box-containing protein